MDIRKWGIRGGIACLALFLFACEQEFTPPIVTDPADIVVEGYIEAGENATPPYIILTRSFPFFREIDQNQLNDSFVHDAEVKVSDGSNEVRLTEFCLAELTPEQRVLAGELLGLEVDSIGFNFCIYIDISGTLTGEAGKTYDLEINVEGKTLRSSTYIPIHVPLTRLEFEVPPGEPNDSLMQLRASINDPAGVTNYYRYQTGRNGGALRYPAGGSVVDDRLFDGQTLEFPLTEAEPDGQDFDFATYGLYQRGDTISIKWITIDEDHFNFINTLEFATVNQGPFSNYTRIDHNIEGGLGIWGGLSASYYNLIVPEN